MPELARTRIEATDFRNDVRRYCDLAVRGDALVEVRKYRDQFITIIATPLLDAIMRRVEELEDALDIRDASLAKKRAEAAGERPLSLGDVRERLKE